MVSLLDPGIGGDGYSSPTLASVGTTRFNVYPPESGEASSREDYEPQLQADVTAGLYGGSVTVEWRFGSTKVAEHFNPTRVRLKPVTVAVAGGGV